MSAEPTRRVSYSKDLRWRIVWQRLAKDLKYERIAQNLSISVGTVHNTLKLFEQTGEVDPRKREKREGKLDNYHASYVIGLVLAEPSLKLPELIEIICDISGTTVSSATLCRLLASHGFSRKKIQRVALQRRIDFRASFMANASLFTKEMFVFVDETGCNLKDMLRMYGYSLRGERAISRTLQIRGQRVSSIAGICSEGVLAVHKTTGTVNGDIFFDYLRGDLLPELLPFNGSNPRSIIVMDNCAIHHIDDVRELIEGLGFLLLFLPPYSPDLNPIELTFSYIKQYLKDHEIIMNTIPIEQLLKSAFDTITPIMCNAWIDHCGYT